MTLEAPPSQPIVVFPSGLFQPTSASPKNLLSLPPYLWTERPGSWRETQNTTLEAVSIAVSGRCWGQSTGLLSELQYSKIIQAYMYNEKHNKFIKISCDYNTIFCMTLLDFETYMDKEVMSYVKTPAAEIHITYLVTLQYSSCSFVRYRKCVVRKMKASSSISCSTITQAMAVPSSQDVPRHNSSTIIRECGVITCLINWNSFIFKNQNTIG